MRTDQLVRIIVHDHADQFVRDLDPAQVASAVLVEEVNGENSLTVTTAQELGKGDRLIVRDGMGTWHEYVVLGVESRHAEGGLVLHEHYCVWSLMHDLSATYVDDQFGCGIVPGHASVPQPARRALECALEGTGRWAIGTITVTAQSSASFYRRSGWDAMKTVLERWGGELRATITVSTTGVVGRAVDLLEHVGASTATRRFDYGADLTGIKRTLADEVWPCRIVPLGKSSETEAGGYTRRPGIADVNGGVPWLQDDSMVTATRLPDGSGGWEYPTSIVTNDTYEDPADLKAWALEHIGDYTTPTVTYEASVAQFAEAGLDPHGVALGDEVAIVDRTFGEGGLRLMARVTKIRRDLCDPAKAELTIGNADTSLAAQLGDISRTLAELGSQVASGSEYQSSSAYLDALVGRLNDEINATGGYWYIVPGLGTRTYDVPVSDPAVGAEASQVVEVRGGTMRIANSRDSAGNWEWRTVIVSGELIADNVRALNVNAGYISSYDGASYWDLDTGVFERNLAMELKWSDTGFSVSGGSQASGGTGTALTSGERYLICFDVASGTDTSGLKLWLGARSNLISTTYSRALLGRDDGTTARYSAWTVNDNTAAESAYSFSILASNDSGHGTVTFTNMRVYEFPTTGNGAIDFRTASSDGTDELKAYLTAGSLGVTDHSNKTELVPGQLLLASVEGVTTEVALTPQDSSTRRMIIRYDPTNTQLTIGSEYGNTAGRLRLTGDQWMLNGPLRAYNFADTITDASTLFSRTYATISSCKLSIWGAFCTLTVSFRFASAITLTNGWWKASASVNGSVAELNYGYRPRHGVNIHGERTTNGLILSGGISTNGDISIHVIGGPPTVTSIAAGTTLSVSATYML